MGLSLSFIKETIKINAIELRGNKELTNELLVDDIMLAFGYNKKRNTGVKRVYGAGLDWEISIEGHNRFVVRTLGYGNDLDTEVDDTAKDYDLVIVTNGEQMDIYKLDVEDTKPIFSINIFDESESVTNVLNCLTMDSYSVENIVKMYEETLLNTDKVNSIIEENMDGLSEYVLGVGGYDKTDRNIELVKSRLSGSGVKSEIEASKELLLTNIDGLNTKIANLTDKIYELEDDKKMNLQTITRLSSAAKVESSDTKTVTELRDKIIDLTNINVGLEETIKELKENIKGMKNSGKEKENEINNTAKSLLDTVEDNPEMDRAYVAVINTKLFQNDDLYKFVGTAIEELYDVVAFKLMPILFDGDVYKLAQPAQRKDFTINNKSYDINLDGLAEDEVIAKLMTLFSKFDDVILNCKMVGTKREKIEEVADGESTDDLVVEDDIEFDDEIVEQDETSVEENDTEKLIGVPLSKLASLAWAEGVVLNSIQYVGSESLGIYKVSESLDKNESYMSAMLSKTIDSLLSLCDNFDESVNILRQTDLSKVSRYLEIINNDNRRNPRIAFTRFVINGIDGVNKYVPILNGIAEAIKLDTESIKIYLRGEFVEGSEAEKYVADEKMLYFENNTAYTRADESDGNVCTLVTGSITDLVILTRNSLRVQSELFEKCEAIKTNYIASKLDTDEDVQNVFTKIIEKGLDDGIEFDPSSVGKVLNSEYMVISDSTANVSTSFMTINVRGKAYFVTKMEEWQLMYALIKLHSIIFKNKSVGIRLKINQSAYNFYFKDFKTCEPSLKLSVRSIVEYINDRIK